MSKFKISVQIGFYSEPYEYHTVWAYDKKDALARVDLFSGGLLLTTKSQKSATNWGSSTLATLFMSARQFQKRMVRNDA